VAGDVGSDESCSNESVRPTMTDHQTDMRIHSDTIIAMLAARGDEEAVQEAFKNVTERDHEWACEHVLFLTGMIGGLIEEKARRFGWTWPQAVENIVKARNVWLGEDL